MLDEVENGQAEGEKATQDVDLSTSAQLRALREYAQRNGYQVVRDEAESGCTAARPTFEEIMALASDLPPQRIPLIELPVF